MGPLVVIVLDPTADALPGLREAPEVVLPHALVLQAAEEAFDDAVLLRSVAGCLHPHGSIRPADRTCNDRTGCKCVYCAYHALAMISPRVILRA